MSHTVREVMTPNAECVQENETVTEAAKKLARFDIGSMPICGEDGRLKGMLTDRDIVLKVIAADQDPARTTTGSLAEGTPWYVGADDTLEDAQRMMADHQVRRLPVIDDHTLVGMLAQADIATFMAESSTGDMVKEISHP